MKELKKKPDHRLSVRHDKVNNEIHIEGNKSGLEYLIAACRSILGQPPGPNHWHFSEEFYTLDAGSAALSICYTEGR